MCPLDLERERKRMRGRDDGNATFLVWTHNTIVKPHHFGSSPVSRSVTALVVEIDPEKLCDGICFEV